MINAQPKPLRGTHVLEREAKRYQLEQAERRAKAKAKRRDSWGCRWPEVHKCRGGIEVAHVFRDKSTGGTSHTCNLMSLDAFIHRLGPTSVHSKDLRVEPMTDLGADGPCAFWRRDTHGIWFMVGREIRIGVIEKD